MRGRSVGLASQPEISKPRPRDYTQTKRGFVQACASNKIKSASTHSPCTKAIIARDAGWVAGWEERREELALGQREIGAAEKVVALGAGNLLAVRQKQSWNATKKTEGVINCACAHSHKHQTQHFITHRRERRRHKHKNSFY